MLKPSQCYFHIDYDSDISCSIVTIVPIAYWTTNNCMLDEELDIELPEYLDQEMESTFLTTEDEVKVRHDLLSLGFKENKDFSAFMNESSDEDI